MIYTFYSFKGGVGRSMAMANVAYELASRGLRVLAIDFDLEAPGLERYFRVPLETVHANRGVIDLIDSFKHALSGTGRIDDSAEFRRLQERYICPIATFGGRGQLDLMPAGRRLSEDDRRTYALAVRTFDWQDFYFNWEGEAFFEWLRRTLDGRDGQPGLYDVVLADSRTGVTEMGGVCACQLADVVVMLSAPNHQNIDGTRELAQDLDSPAVRQLRRGRPPLQIVVVPARVEQREPERLPWFIETFDRAFEGYRPKGFIDLDLHFHELALPYTPEFAFEERVTDRQSAAGQALSDRFKRLADALLVLAGPPLPEPLRTAAEAALLARDGSAAPRSTRAFDATQRFAGFDAYLSCSTTDQSAADALADALREPPWLLNGQVFANDAATTQLRPAPLTAQLMRHAQAVVLLAGRDGVVPGQREELKAARSLPTTPRLVQVLLPGAADDAFQLAFGGALRDALLVDLRRGPEDRAALALLAEALKGPSAPEHAPPPADAAAAAPFPGARAYAEGDAGAFFARQDDVAALRGLVESQRRVVLSGPAGAGKTSLVQAGLLPVLRGSTSVRHIQLLDLRTTALPPWSPSGDAPADATLLVLDHADEADAATQDAIAAAWQDPAGARLLVVWRGCPLARAEAAALAHSAAEWTTADAHPEHPLHHVASGGKLADTLLADPALAARQMALAPLDAEPLRAGIEAALAAAGRRAEPGLIERLITDAGAAPAMAAIQRALRRLWDEQRGGFLTNDSYDRMGGVDGATNAAFDAAIDALPSDQRGIVAALIARLLRGDASPLRARPMSWAREVSLPVFQGRAAALVQTLAQGGFLRVQRLASDVEIALAHTPRSWPGILPTLAAAPWRPDVSTITTLYAAWAQQAPGPTLQAELPATPGALESYLSIGEARFATRVRRQQQRRRRLRALAAAVFVGVIAAAVSLSGLQRQQVEDAQVKAELVVAARSQLDRVVQSTAPAPLGTPAATTRRRVVVQRTGDDPREEDLIRALFAGDAFAADFAIERQIERLKVPVCGDVRFHNPADAAAAARLTELINAALAQAGDLRRLQVNDRSNTRAANQVAAGTLEVWLPPLTAAPAVRQDRWGPSRLVPAGCAVVGSDEKGRATLMQALKVGAEAFYERELPLSRTYVEAYYLGEREVTLQQFARYQAECQRQRGCPAWAPRYVDPQAEPDRPAVFVSWAQADAYCRWAGGRLPSDLEWEKAARGVDGRFWPWGDRPDDSLFQGKTSSPRRPVAVGGFPGGASPYGILDLAGNVWEFTADNWHGEGSGHTIRGGSYLNTLMESRASVRWATGRETAGAEYLGFRCAAAVSGTTPPPAPSR